VKHFETQSAVDVFKLMTASVCVLAIFVASSDGRAEPTGGHLFESAVGEARVVIHAGIELGQEGKIYSRHPDIARLLQVNAQECDPEIRKIRAGCVLLIYEIQ